MLEKQASSTFNAIFHNYKIWTMTTKQGGLPDKGIQLNNSRIIWFELKVVTIRPEATHIRVPNLESHQAVWLSNWQRNGGDCYLFIGCDNIKYRTITYGVWQCARWQDWSRIPFVTLTLDDFQIYTMDPPDIFYWFRNKYGTEGNPARSQDQELLTTAIK
jgi:hypothetical protein